MNDNYQMSPLARFLVGILQKGAFGSAALLILFAGILTYQRMTPDGGIDFRQEDYGFLGVLAALLALAVYLVRAIKKEMNKPGE